MSLRPLATAECPDAINRLAHSLGAASEQDPSTMDLDWLQMTSEFAGLRDHLLTIKTVMRVASGVAAQRLVQAKLDQLQEFRHGDAAFRLACFDLAEEIAQYGFTTEAHRLFITLYQQYRRLWHEARLAHREGQ